MNKRTYWKILKKWNKLRFIIISKIYKFSEKFITQKENSAISLIVIKEIFKKVILELFLIVPIIYLNNFVAKKVIVNIDIQYMLDFLYAGLGIVGVILGLYCANISSIYSSIYTNAPLNLSKLFANDIISNKSVKQITGYLVFNLLLVFLLLTKSFKPGVVLVIVVIISTIYVIIAFSINGNRSLYLSNTFSISNLSYNIINSAIKKLAHNSWISNDINIQNHLRIICSKELNNLKEIAYFNSKIPSTQNTYMKEFVCNNLKILQVYLGIKSQITNESYWFEEAEEYSQWHNSTSSEISIALDSGTMINNKKIKNYNWFEKELLYINEFCVKKFINDESFDCLYSYILLFSNYSDYFIRSNTNDVYVNHIITIFDFMNNRLSEENITKNDDSITGIYELLIICYMDITIKLRNLIKDTDINEIKKEFIYNITNNKNPNKHSFYLNDIKLKKLRKCIETELKIEHKIITADWYIEQFISETIYTKIGNNIALLIRYLNYIDKQISFLEKHKFYEPVCLVFCKLSELKIKSNNLINDVAELLNELTSKHLEKTIIWKEIQFDEYKNKLNQLYNNLPNRFRSNVVPIAINKWDSRKNAPDYLGQCYNITCSILIEAIVENNFEKFKLSYENFLGLMLLYYEYIRCDLIKVKEPHLQRGVLYSLSQPMLEYSMISGLAILLGEFSNDIKWKKFIESKIEDSVVKINDFKKTIEIWVKLLMETKSSFIGIGNRDILHTSWEGRVSNSLKDKGYVKFEDVGYGNLIVKSDSSIINCFCRSNFDIRGISDSEDVFCEVCLNKYLDDDKKYKSIYDWEKNSNEEQN